MVASHEGRAMQRKRQPDRDDEPAVTFELEESSRTRQRNRLGAAGAAAVAGAGLVAGGATPESPDSLDVFDQKPEPEGQDGAVPITSYLDLGANDGAPEFPPIDFGQQPPAATGAEDALFGASSRVGGGIALDDTATDGLFGASDVEVEPVPDSLVDDGGTATDEGLDIDPDIPEDIDS